MYDRGNILHSTINVRYKTRDNAKSILVVRLHWSDTLALLQLRGRALWLI